MTDGEDGVGAAPSAAVDRTGSPNGAIGTGLRVMGVVVELGLFVLTLSLLFLLLALVFSVLVVGVGV